jgi:xanthine dehydrogenase accessory factor
MSQAESAATIMQRLEAVLAAQQLVAQVTRLTGPHQGSKLLLFPDGRRYGTLGDTTLDEAAQGEAGPMMETARGQLARTVELQGESGAVRLFIEVFPPPPHLIIFGGVHVAVPLTSFAKRLGFRVTLVDPRTTFANAQRFPDADTIIPEWPQEAIEQLTIGPSVYVAILTHDPKLDEPALKAVLGKGAAYVGAIGSRKTHQERFERMAQHGVRADDLRQVFAPIGLDINAETPEEIALAIMAEVVAVRRGGEGGFMKDG